MDVHSVVDHVSFAKKLDLSLEKLFFWIKLTFLEKFEERKDEMTVELGRDSRG